MLYLREQISKLGVGFDTTAYRGLLKLVSIASVHHESSLLCLSCGGNVCLRCSGLIFDYCELCYIVIV